MSIQPTAGEESNEYLYRIRDIHIEIEHLLQSLSETSEDKPCRTCKDICCNEEICRESIESDFLRFLLGPLLNDYCESLGWYQSGAGCRLKYGRPIVCYEYYCEKFQGNDWKQIQLISRALKKAYSDASAGEHILEVRDISRININKLEIILKRLEKVRDFTNSLLRQQISDFLKPNRNKNNRGQTTVSNNQRSKQWPAPTA